MLYRIILLLIFFSSGECLSQKDLRITGGIGIPEMLHIGVSYNIPKWHFDAEVGNWPGDNQISFGGNASYHFGETKDSFIQPRWFTSLGMIYMFYNSSQRYTEDIYANLRLGRDFQLNNWFNLSFSFGIGVNVYHYHQNKDPGGWDFDIYFPVIPSGQFSLAFRIATFDKS